jgi:hypothetical protein
MPDYSRDAADFGEKKRKLEIWKRSVFFSFINLWEIESRAAAADFAHSKRLEIARAFWTAESHNSLSQKLIAEFARINPDAMRRPQSEMPRWHRAEKTTVRN